MYLFSRSARLAPGRTREAMTWAVGITEKVNQITELDVQLWTPVFSPRIGTLSWTAVAEDLEMLENAQAKLMVDDGYVAEVDRGAAFASTEGIDDALLQVVHGTVDPDRRPQYVSIAASQIAPGQLARGMEVGVEIAQRVEKLSGVPTLFVAGATGPYGGVAWISGFETVKELQAAESAVNGDPGFIELVDTKGSQAFIAQATTQTIAQRIV